VRMKEHDRQLMNRLLGTLERMQLDRYVEYISNRRRMIWMNLVYGILRGLGFSFGFTVLGAIGVVLLTRLAESNMPQISGFIAEVIHEIQSRI